MPVRSFVLETANSPGTGTFNLAGASAGRRTFFQAYGNTGAVPFVATDGTQWEEGFGTATGGAPDTLSRDVITETSQAGSLAKRNFQSSVQIYSNIPAARALFASQDNTSVSAGNRVLSELAAGSVATDAARLGDVGWRLAQPVTTVTSPQGGVAFSLPLPYTRFRVEFQDVRAASTAGLYVRMSQTGGTTFLEGASDYTILNAVSSSNANTPSLGAANANYVSLSPPGDGSVLGSIEFDVFSAQYLARTLSATAAGVRSIQDTGVYIALRNRPTHILLAFVGGANIISGRFRLLGAVL